MAVTTHGQSKTKVYKVWHAMIGRCSNPNTTHYERYGGRGIKVCDRWLRFENFIADMGPRPDGMTVERINNNGDYEPSNCRWATRREQSSNMRRNTYLVFNNEKRCLSEWARAVGIHKQIIIGRLKKGWTTEQALTIKPTRSNRLARILKGKETCAAIAK